MRIVELWLIFFFVMNEFSCLPCGHIYGMSCLKKWLQQRKNPGKVIV
jgi:hypothetical protein